MNSSPNGSADNFNTQLTDGVGRPVTYLRLSVTDRCNLRCRYCMPVEGVAGRPHSSVLTFEESLRLCVLLVQNGVTTIRLTGGEPLVRRGVISFIRSIAAIDGLKKLSLTTNGTRLAQMARELKSAGVHELNISLDTLRADRYHFITRSGKLADVLDGIDAARRCGLQIKMNAVALSGYNDDELADMVRFVGERDLTIKFIELMPIGEGLILGRDAFMSARDIRERLSDDFVLYVTTERPGTGPASYFRACGRGLPAQGVLVGFIPAVTECFCASCDRLRISAEGLLYPCLTTDAATDLCSAMRAGASDTELLSMVESALSHKVAHHSLHFNHEGIACRRMSAIGG